MAWTAKYRRLPPDAGTPVFDQEVHLSGFRDIRIPSRVIAERQIHDFLSYCEHEAAQPAARMILGSWGEGKTETFNCYIRPQTEQRGHRAFRLTSRSIANAYTHHEGLDTSEARLFLAAVFYVLREERLADIPALGSTPLISWIERCLEALGCHRRRLFLFVDEVEQLLHEPQDLRRLMLGIKQLLDGDFAGAFAKPALASSVCVFLACTPEAYNRIATDPDVRQVFGGYGRRMDRICVESISLTESVHFLHRLLMYAWDGGLPDPMPVSSPGILVALATIAKRNMGHMVSLTSRLLSSARQEANQMEVIRAEHLMDFATGRTINIEGTDTACFEDQLYHLLVHGMEGVGVSGESFQRLLMAFLFDQRPHETSEIAAIIGPVQWEGLEALWLSFLNRALAKLGHRPGLLKLQPVAQPDVLFSNLASLADRDHPELFRFGENLFSRGELEGILADWRFTPKGALQSSIVVPVDVGSIQDLLGPLQARDAEELLRIFRDLAAADSTFYCLPRDLISQLFPPPCPPGLEFIRDASERFNLWRRAVGEYESRFQQDLPKALVALGSRVTTARWRFDGLRAGPDSVPLRAVVLYRRGASEREINLRAWLMARCSFDERDLQQCEDQLESTTEPPHLWLILTAEPVAESLIARMSRPLRQRCSFVHVHAIYAKQMMASYWHLACGGAIYGDILTHASTDLLERDLRLYVHLDGWLDEARRVGYAVDNPFLSQGTHRGLVNALRLLLNTQGMAMTLQEVFEWNRKVLRRLMPYGSKGGLVPETDRLESFEGFRACVGDLQTNGFVDIDAQSRPQLPLSPCEAVILEVLNDKEVHKDEWANHLIVLATPETLVEDLYVETLVQRGLVERKKKQGRGTAKNFRGALPIAAIRGAALEKARDFRRRAEVLSQNSPSFSAVAHLAIAKERDVQVVTLRDILTIIDEREKLLQSPHDSTVVSANAMFLVSLFEDLGDLFLHVARKADLKVTTVIQSLSGQYQESVQQTVPQQLSVVPTLLDISIDVCSLAEIAELRGIVEEAEAIPRHAAAATSETVQRAVQALVESERRAHFWFDAAHEEDCCHNYHAYTASLAEKLFTDKKAALDRHVMAITDAVQGPAGRREALRRQVLSCKAEDSEPVSQILLTLLKAKLEPATVPEAVGPSPVGLCSLREIRQILNEQFVGLTSAMTRLETCYVIWQRIWQVESKLQQIAGQGRGQLTQAEAFFDLPEHVSAIQDLRTFFAEGESRCAGLLQGLVAVEPEAFEKVRVELVTLTEHFEQVDQLVQTELWEPLLVKRANVLTTLEKCIHACEVIGDLPVSLRTSYEDLARQYSSETSLASHLRGGAPCSGELAGMNEIRWEANDILSRYLTESERQVFAAVVELASGKGTAGISIDQLKGRLCAVPQGEVFAVLLSLWEKGIVSVRVEV